MISRKNFNLTEYNSYYLNAICAYVWFPENELELLEIYKKNTSTRKIILGNGNNVILSKDAYAEHFIILNGNFNKTEVQGDKIIAEAGTTMLELSELALTHSLSGLETFYDIPSSVGGAVIMNAGASGDEIKDILIKVRYLDLADMQIKEIDKNSIGYEYRNSYFQKNTNKIVLKAWFNLNPGSRKMIELKMEESKANRWAKQPREYPNCGSVFKRPQGKFVGPMLDELGLKGYTIGGAQVSEKHSGFIVNLGGATGEDILDLIKYVQQKVLDKFDVNLEVEQRII